MEDRVLGKGSPRVTVVIPNWNGAHHLEECFSSLSAQSFHDFEVVVVDNGSSDGSIAWLAENVPGVRVIRRATNGGFSVAVNEGIRASSSEFVALLNNDTAVDPSWLEQLVAEMDARPGFDVAASLMVFYSDPATVNSAGDAFSLRQGTGVNRGIWQRAEDYRSAGRVLGASAGAALYRRTFFADVGLFDEQFFVAAEDTDINLRGLIAGKKVLYVPTAVVKHKLMATRGMGRSWIMDRSEIRNNALAAAKNLPASMLAGWLLLWLWRGFRSAIPLRPSKWHLLPSAVSRTVRGLAWEVRGVVRGLLGRREVWARRRASLDEIKHWLRVGFEPLPEHESPGRDPGGDTTGADR